MCCSAGVGVGASRMTLDVLTIVLMTCVSTVDVLMIGVDDKSLC